MMIVNDLNVADEDKASESLKHKSVLVKEVIDFLNLKPHGRYLDATFGCGGHTEKILTSEPTCKVVALDWDKSAVENFSPRLKEKFGDRLDVIWGNFGGLYKISKKHDLREFDGILADFGTSQYQIECRPGFSFRHDTPLDMRMSSSHSRSQASEILNDASESELKLIFRKYGEERYASFIVKGIVSERAKKRIETTGQLETIVKNSLPGFAKRELDKKRNYTNPSTKVFQALRIAVNDELGQIESFLKAAPNYLNKGGRLVCISFHSLEDRIVKRFFVDESKNLRLKLLTKSPVTATDEEKKDNPSSRSAKLRAAEKL